MNIGNAIKELRKEKGLNQRELAAASGLTQTSLSQIESGVKRPNPGTLKKLCEFFGVSETVIYLLATDVSDIPDEKKEIFSTIFPNIKKTLIEMFR